MKHPSIATLFLTSALLCSQTAFAGTLAPWNYSAPLSSRGVAYESATNVVTMPELYRAPLGQSGGFPDHDSESRLDPDAFGKPAFLARGNLRRSNGNATRGGENTLHASDGSANYTGNTWLNGTGNEGEGWSGAWTAYKGTGNLDAACKVEAPSLALETKNEMGEVIVGRDLASPLGSGEMTVHSWNDFGVDFVGFSVYGTRISQGSGELFRWGLGAETATSGDPGVGYVYSTDGGQTYAMLSDEASSGFTDYSLTWAMVDGGLSFTVSAFDQSSTAKFDPASFFVAASSVSSIAVVASGDKRIAFDFLEIEGTPFTPVPEPGTISLLLAGAALLFARRRAR